MEERKKERKVGRVHACLCNASPRAPALTPVLGGHVTRPEHAAEANGSGDRKGRKGRKDMKERMREKGRERRMNRENREMKRRGMGGEG